MSDLHGKTIGRFTIVVNSHGTLVSEPGHSFRYATDLEIELLARCAEADDEIGMNRAARAQLLAAFQDEQQRTIEAEDRCAELEAALSWALDVLEISLERIDEIDGPLLSDEHYALRKAGLDKARATLAPAVDRARENLKMAEEVGEPWQVAECLAEVERLEAGTPAVETEPCERCGGNGWEPWGVTLCRKCKGRRAPEATKGESA